MKGNFAIKLWLVQRVSGMLLGVFVVIHLATMILAIQGGLTAREIMERTSENWLVGSFYGVFVIAASLHGSIGLRTVAQEVIGWRGASLNVVSGFFCVLLVVIGLFAVKGLVL